MRSGLNNRDPISLLLYEAKRKPEVAALVERIHELTDEDIDAAKVPLAWYRKALKQLRAIHHARSVGTPTLDHNGNPTWTDGAPITSASLYEPFFRHGFNPDPEGQLREWMGGEGWVEIKRANQILMSDGHLLWFPDTGGVWVDSIFVEHYNPRFLSQSKVLGRCTKTGYALAKRDRILAIAPEFKEPEKPKELFKMSRLDGRTDGLNVR